MTQALTTVSLICICLSLLLNMMDKDAMKEHINVLEQRILILEEKSQ